MKVAFLFRKYHKWLALVVGIQALIWCISGLYMTAVHIDIIHGDHLVKETKAMPLDSRDVKELPDSLLIEFDSIKSVRLAQTIAGPTYFIRTKSGQVRVSATTLEKLPPIDEAQIRAIANHVYAGESQIESVILLDEYPQELGGRKLPIWRVQFDDWLVSTLYFLPDTGQLRSKRTDLWRWFDILWMLHIMDYETREEINNNLLRVASSIGLLLALTGVGLLFHSFKNQRAKENSAIGMIKKVHKWIALLLGLQLVIWMLSGLMFSLLPHKEVSGRYLISRAVTIDWQANGGDLKRLAGEYEELVSIGTGQLLGKAVYQIKTISDFVLVDAVTMEQIEIDESVAKLIAVASYSGDGQLVSLSKENDKTLESRKFNAPVWHAKFDDELNSSLYLSAKSGSVYGVKTDTWRLFDIFWMLHIMDYSERNDMNNSLVIFSASLICFIALTGVWLIFSVFSLKDFNLLARFQRVPLMIRNDEGFTSEIFARKNERLYFALSNAGFELPSNCGGGGGCGLCKVKVDAGIPVSSSDKKLINQEDLAAGYRLACQVELEKGTEVDLPGKVLQQQVLSCKVISNDFKTPMIKELVLEVPNSTNFEFNSGEYVLIHIPPGESKLAEIEVPQDYRDIWYDSNIEQYISRRSEALTRAYSMANEPSDKQHIVLNIRLALPESTSGESGKGSSYLFSVVPGEAVKISGPFGHFHAKNNEREMVFIGGGAGMAPLRSHIFHQLNTLDSTRKISYWFGARNTREIFYQQEFERLAQTFENFEWHVGLSHCDDGDEWSGFKGMIHEMVEQAFKLNEIDIKQSDFYVCGPALMNQAVVSLLAAYGVDSSRILVDDFGI